MLILIIMTIVKCITVDRLSPEHQKLSRSNHILAEKNYECKLYVHHRPMDWLTDYQQMPRTVFEFLLFTPLRQNSFSISNVIHCWPSIGNKRRRVLLNDRLLQLQFCQPQAWYSIETVWNATASGSSSSLSPSSVRVIMRSRRIWGYYWPAGSSRYDR